MYYLSLHDSLVLRVLFRSGGDPVPYKRDLIPDTVPTSSKYVLLKVASHLRFNSSVSVVVTPCLISVSRVFLTL